MLKTITYIMTGATIVLFIKIFSGQVKSPPPGQGAPEVLWAFPIITIILWALCSYKFKSKDRPASSDVNEENDIVRSDEKEDVGNMVVDSGNKDIEQNKSAAEYYKEALELYNTNKIHELRVLCLQMGLLYPRSKEWKLVHKLTIELNK